MKKKLFKTAYGIAICFILLGLFGCNGNAISYPQQGNSGSSTAFIPAYYNETASDRSIYADPYSLTISKTLNNKE